MKNYQFVVKPEGVSNVVLTILTIFRGGGVNENLVVLRGTRGGGVNPRQIEQWK